MNTIREKNGISVVQVGDDFHVVKKMGKLVLSVMPSDMKAGETWMAKATEEGVAYVSRRRTRGAAMAAFRREARRLPNQNL